MKTITEWKEMWSDRRRRKPYLVALLLAALFVTDLFFLNYFFNRWFGAAGLIIGELWLAATGVIVFLIFRGKMKVIFPFKKPEWMKVAGTVVFWMGAYGATLIVTGIMSVLFPEPVMEASEGVSSMISRMSMLPALFVMALMPAVCEEIAFRGALQSCFRGTKNKWIGLVLVSLFFGACHGSIWRMIPTAMLGMAMGYLLLETDNMIYNMLFHFINNAVPVVMIGIMNLLFRLTGAGNAWEIGAGAAETAAVQTNTLGIYLLCGGGAPILLYLGNYLIHRGQPGYEKGVFPKEKRRQTTIVISLSAGLLLIGFFLWMFEIVSQVLQIFRLPF